MNIQITDRIHKGDYPISSYSQLTSINPDFYREGYEISSWNTEQDGSGTLIPLDKTFEISCDNTIYAQWKPKTHYVIYNSNHTDGRITGYITFSGINNKILSASINIDDPKSNYSIYIKKNSTEQSIGKTTTFNTSDTGIFSFITRSDGYDDLSSKNYRFTRTETQSEEYSAVEAGSKEIAQQYVEAEKKIQVNLGRKVITLKDYTSEWYSITQKSATSLTYVVKWGTWEHVITYKWSNVI